MIALLTGKLIFKSAQYLIVDVGGVGYRVSVSLNSFSALPEAGDAVTIHIHTHLREDQLTLYGFMKTDEKDIFLKLISVSGVGPKMALTILSGIPSHELAVAIADKNTARLQAIPGVGKKTAERITVELKDKLASQIVKTGEIGGATSGPRFYDDVLSALTNLGYQKAQAEKAMMRVSWNEVENLETALRMTLKELV